MIKSKNPYETFNNYILRTPLYSFNFYKNCFEEKTISKDKLQSLFNTAVINEAIYLASPELHLQLKKWFQGAITDPKKVERLKISLLKYITRLSSRCTPFGLFASCSIGEFTSSTKIELDNIDSYKRLTSFDMTFLVRLSNLLTKNEILKEQLIFYPNTSLYKIGNHYRYVEYTIKDKKREYMLEGIKYSVFIEQILNEAKTGMKILDLANGLVDDAITLDDAKIFINELIDNQILVSELQLSLTGRDNLEQIISILQKKENIGSITKLLYGFHKKLNKIDTNLWNLPSVYKKFLSELKQFDSGLESKYLFQTDLYATIKKNKLNNDISKTIKSVMHLLNKITLPHENKSLSVFKKAYIDRYEDNELPLTLVLDGEAGIGYNIQTLTNNSLIDDLQFEQKKKRSKFLEWGDVDTILHKKLIETSKLNNHIINLSDEDFNHIVENWDDLPDTMSTLIEIINIDGKQKIVIDSFGGSSGASLLTRFGNGDELLKKHITRIADTEAEINNNIILAEIVHLPQDRVGNILKRPALRSYEIPYLAKSSLPKKQQIPIDDIVISVKNDRIFLRSLKFNKYIEPKLTNAHNYSNDALHIYHFLCDLQYQNKRSHISFFWNTILKEYSSLPRVEYKNCILSKAQWLINSNDLKKIIQEGINIDNINIWREKINLPKYAQLVEGDNTLLVDFENKDSIKMLFNSIKNKKTFLLQEFLFEEEGIVKHNGQTFCNQFVVSLYNQEKLNLISNGR